MRGVTISNCDATGRLLAIDVRDILRALVDENRDSQWRLMNVESLGARAVELHELADRKESVGGAAMLEIVAGVDQIIDGVFEAYRPLGQSPWLRLRAVDGVAFDVESEDAAVLDRIRSTFDRVDDLPE